VELDDTTTAKQFEPNVGPEISEETVSLSAFLFLDSTDSNLKQKLEAARWVQKKLDKQQIRQRRREEKRRQVSNPFALPLMQDNLGDKASRNMSIIEKRKFSAWLNATHPLASGSDPVRTPPSHAPCMLGRSRMTYPSGVAPPTMSMPPTIKESAPSSSPPRTRTPETQGRKIFLGPPETPGN
jgi:hypothetical protein